MTPQQPFSDTPDSEAGQHIVSLGLPRPYVMDPAGDDSGFLAPWDPEPPAYRSAEMMAYYQQNRQIRALLRAVGMGEDVIQGWTERLQSVSAIVQQGCSTNGIPDAGTLLLDMISELLQDVTRSYDPTPAATTG